MAKFRTNYSRRRGGGGMIVRIALFAVIVVVFLIAFKQLAEQQQEAAAAVEPDYPSLEHLPVDSIYFLPSVNRGSIIVHKYYALSYVEEWELPEWVAYELTGERLRKPWVRRTNDYRPDPKVPEKSSHSADFRSLEFDRGHLVPAADMAFSEEAMSETFFMSNMAPQRPGFNKGIWRELEELTRDWAKRFHHLYVVSGPIVKSKEPSRIGQNRVVVPDAFYRVLLDLTEPELKAIAFIIPNQTSDVRLKEYAVAVDSVEALTGIDFFHNLLEPGLEAELESKYDIGRWPFDEKKYQKRVNSWNRMD